MPYLTVAGNIGVGKSSFVKFLARDFNIEGLVEPATENPYLSDFYFDMKTHAFYAQTWFLGLRAKQHHMLTAARPERFFAQDRSIFEDAFVFAENLKQNNILSSRDYETYFSLFEAAVFGITPPDLVVYLRASVKALQRQILRRGREFEKRMTPDYLANLNTLYDEWILKYKMSPVLTINTDDLDFVNSAKDLQFLYSQLAQNLNPCWQGIFGARFSKGRQSSD